MGSMLKTIIEVYNNCIPRFVILHLLEMCYVIIKVPLQMYIVSCILHINF